MQEKEESKQLYEVWVVRYQDEPLAAFSTDKYDAAYEKWKELTEAWTASVKDKVPFVLMSPIVTAFDPGTIKEVTVRPVMKVPASKYNNPYQQDMLKNGLTNTLRNPGNILNSNILDEGYQG